MKAALADLSFQSWGDADPEAVIHAVPWSKKIKNTYADKEFRLLFF